MIEEQAVITAKSDTQVTFEVERQKPCGICGQTKGCGNAMWGKLLGHQQLSVKAENKIDANVGDHVIVGVEEKVILNAAFYLYVVPLLGLFLGASVMHLIFGQELFVIAGAVIGLWVGFVVVKQFSNRVEKNGQSINGAVNPPSYPVVLRQATYPVDNESM